MQESSKRDGGVHTGQGPEGNGDGEQEGAGRPRVRCKGAKGQNSVQEGMAMESQRRC